VKGIEGTIAQALEFARPSRNDIVYGNTRGRCRYQYCDFGSMFEIGISGCLDLQCRTGQPFDAMFAH